MSEPNASENAIQGATDSPASHGAGPSTPQGGQTAARPPGSPSESGGVMGGERSVEGTAPTPEHPAADAGGQGVDPPVKRDITPRPSAGPGASGPQVQGRPEGAKPPANAGDKPGQDAADKPDDPSKPKPSGKGVDKESPVGSRGLKEGGSTEPQIPVRLLNQIRQVFVPWDGLEEAAEAVLRQEHRVLVIAGEPGTGRFTAAAWLGLRLLGDSRTPRIVTVSSAEAGDVASPGWIRAEARQRQTVYVVQDPPALGAFLAGEQYGSLDQGLFDRDSWLILTARPSQVTAAVLPGPCLLSSRSLTRDQLGQAYERHCAARQLEPGWEPGPAEDRVHQTTRALIRESREGKEGFFTRAPQIVQYLTKLPEYLRKGVPEDEGQLRNALARLARELADEVMQAWFDQLSPNEQFLALMVEAVRGIPREAVESLYCQLALRLCRHGGLLQDPRRFGFADLYRRINAMGVPRLEAQPDGSSVEFEWLEFAHEGYRQEVLRQMRSRHHLLWEVVKSVVEEHLPTLPGNRQAPDRRVLGELIARLGIHRRDDLLRVLEGLAEHEAAWVAAVPGYVLRELCLLDPPADDFVGEVLRKWAAERDHVWAATAAAWRVYEEAARHWHATAETDSHRRRWEALLLKVEQTLADVAEGRVVTKDELEGSNFLNFALDRMFNAMPSRVRALLRGWIEAGNSQKAAARRALLGIFRAHADPATLTDPVSEALSGLIGPALTFDRTATDTVLSVLQGWITLADAHDRRTAPDPVRPRPPVHPPIRAALLRACNEARDGERNQLRRALTTDWLRDGNPQVRAIAQTVIGRARLLDGILADLPGAGRGVLLMDASPEARTNETTDRLLQELFEAVRPQVDLWVGQLGNATPLGTPGTDLDLDQLASRPPASTILMPWIERLEQESGAAAGAAEFHFAFVMHWRDIVDAADAAGPGSVPLVTLPLQVHHLPESGTGLPPVLLEELAERLSPQIGLPASLLQYLMEAHQELNRQAVRGLNEELSSVLVPIVDDLLATPLGQALGRRTPDRWSEILGTTLLPSLRRSDNPGAAAATELTRLVGRLNEPGPDEGAPDPLRLALGVVHWLAARDLPAAVAWLVQAMDRPTRNAEGTFATAAGMQLLRLHSAGMLRVSGRPGLPPPAVETVAPLLELAPAFARRRSPLALRVLLTALRCWVGDPAWSALLPTHPALRRMADAVPPRLGQSLCKQVDAWEAEPLKDLGEQQVPPGAIALSLRLKAALLARLLTGIRLPRTVLVLVHPLDVPGSRQRIGALARRLHAHYERGRVKHPDLPKFIFLQTGRRDPVCVTGEPAAPDAFTVPPGRVRLSAPCFDALMPAADLAVVLADGPLTDAEDWLPEVAPPKPTASESSPAPRLLLFWDNRRLPRPATGLPWETLDTIENDDQAFNRLVELLQTQLGSSPS